LLIEDSQEDIPLPLTVTQGEIRLKKLYNAYKASLGTASGAGGALTLRNPEKEDVYVTRLIVHVKSKSSLAASIDCGISSTIAASDNLIDGLDVSSSTGCFDNLKNGGTNGKAGQLWPAGQYLTISGSSSLSGLEGNVYIEYTRLG
jgi:hypothetical protein